jgi:hypothetical protein
MYPFQFRGEYRKPADEVPRQGLPGHSRVVPLPPGHRPLPAGRQRRRQLSYLLSYGHRLQELLLQHGWKGRGRDSLREREREKDGREPAAMQHMSEFEVNLDEQCKLLESCCLAGVYLLLRLPLQSGLPRHLSRRQVFCGLFFGLVNDHVYNK